MPNLPIEIIVLMQPFTPVFTERTWDWVQVLLVRAIIAPGKRTVTSVLRVMSMSDESQFDRPRYRVADDYHRLVSGEAAHAENCHWPGTHELTRITTTVIFPSRRNRRRVRARRGPGV